jgi:hypothetical protein
MEQKDGNQKCSRFIFETRPSRNGVGQVLGYSPMAQIAPRELSAPDRSREIDSVLGRHEIELRVMSPLRGKPRYFGAAPLIDITEGILIAKGREKRPRLLHRDPSAVSQRQYSDRARQRSLAAGIQLWRQKLWLLRHCKNGLEPIPHSHGFSPNGRRILPSCAYRDNP